MHILRLKYWMIPVLLLSLSGCGDQALDNDDDAEDHDGPASASAPAGVLRADVETQRAVGLQVGPVTRRRIETTLSLTGWLFARPGSEHATRAPATGFYVPNESAGVPDIGTPQASGQAAGFVRLFLSPQERAQLVVAKEEADILSQQSRVSMEIAETQLASLRDSAASGAVAKTRIKELEEIVERARVAQREAQQMLQFLPAEPYDESLGMKPMAVTSAAAGRVVDVHVRPGHFVVQGDPLWTVADWSTLWLRVPVFTGDLPDIDRAKACRVTAGGLELNAKPIDPPQTSDPGRRTVDLFFEIDNADGTLRPGQPVGVRVEGRELRVESRETARRQTAESLVVPRSAVLWDGTGGAWVYVPVGDEFFRRQRVEVGPATGDAIAIERGLADDDRVVTQGAAALYAEEFKGQIQLDDDD